MKFKKYGLLFLFGISMMCMGACGKNTKNVSDDAVVQANDSAGLDEYLSEYEANYGKKIKKSNIDDYFQDVQIAVMSHRDYGVESVSRYQNTLVFDFFDQSDPYEYTPDGFDVYDPDAEYESTADAPFGYADLPSVGVSANYAE